MKMAGVSFSHIECRSKSGGSESAEAPGLGCGFGAFAAAHDISCAPSVDLWQRHEIKLRDLATEKAGRELESNGRLGSGLRFRCLDVW